MHVLEIVLGRGRPVIVVQNFTIVQSPWSIRAGLACNLHDGLLEDREGSCGADTGVGWAIAAVLAPLLAGRGGGARFSPASGGALVR